MAAGGETPTGPISEKKSLTETNVILSLPKALVTHPQITSLEPVLK